MVGRGWWLLVWTVYAAWTVCFVCGGLSCQQGQEFYDSEQGRCVSCTRCHGSQVVVVPCYVYRDAVCAPAAQFLPTWSRLTQPQAPITLSTPTTMQNHTQEEHGHGKRISTFSNDKRKHLNNHRKTSGHQEGKSGTNKAPSNKSMHSKKNHRKLHNQNGSEKTKKGKSKHHHRHRHSGERTEHRAQNKSLMVNREEAVSGVHISQKIGASESVNENTSVRESVNHTRESGGDRKESVKDISDGANSDKDKDSDSHRPDTADWQRTIFLTVVIVISICVVGLTIATLSHLRNIITKRKLKRVNDTVAEENNGEMRVMEHLLPSHPAALTSRSTVTTRRAGVTYVRSSATTPPVPPASTTTAGEVAVLDSEQISGHVYPPIPFTMDRLLEQRRVLGPSSSVDTNLYIESWQQQDNHPAVQHPPSASSFTAGPRTFLRGTVSACPSPVPVRTYRLGPASASASPIFPVRGLGPTRGRMRGTLISAACALSGSSGGVVSDCTSVAPT
ncbi:uncharacterized protein wgn [Procambarus clarkii]|uniref:uncharacterized protein wgn n=1 Tax=Procambarus clarkii TaxID=6728 RepID=UPI001E6777BA|nr:uncharacterized protein LOC123760633 [Procambarus clarkii]